MVREKHTKRSIGSERKTANTSSGVAPAEETSKELLNSRLRKVLESQPTFAEFEEKVRDLIQKGADPDTKDNSGRTPLIRAAKMGYSGVNPFDCGFLIWLIGKGANINAADDNGYTALMFATSNGHAKEVKILLENGADPNIKAILQTSALKLAHGYFGPRHEIYKLLVQHGATI
jgi:ankyrin repeat protein